MDESEQIRMLKARCCLQFASAPEFPA